MQLYEYKKQNENLTGPLDDVNSRTQLVQSQGNQNKSLPVSKATRNQSEGVPTDTLA